MKKVGGSGIILLMGLLIACSGQPKLMQATVEPEIASPGESITLQVQFSGTYTDMKNVYLTVREYPYDYPMIELSPDMSETGNRWKKEVTVPYDANNGEFHLDINAFVRSGEEIISDGFENNSTGKTGTIILKIK
jgi:hypothetical protein